MRRLLAILLIMTGLGLLVYPAAREHYHHYRCRQLLRAWNENVAGPAGRTENPEARATGLPPKEKPDPAPEQFLPENMIGVLRIPRINLEMPVLPVDTAANLDLSLAHVAHTAGPGEAGNFCVSGHRQLAYGRHFNRLHELEQGDLVTFEGPAETFVYRVFETRVIPPEETAVLEPAGAEKLITLITCHGRKRPFTRFIARGRLVER